MRPYLLSYQQLYRTFPAYFLRTGILVLALPRPWCSRHGIRSGRFGNPGPLRRSSFSGIRRETRSPESAVRAPVTADWYVVVRPYSVQRYLDLDLDLDLDLQTCIHGPGPGPGRQGT